MFRKLKRIPPPRKALVIDPAVQGALLIRMAVYGASGLLYFSIIELLDVVLSDPLQSRGEIVWSFIGRAIYWAPGLFVLMPVFAYDLLQVSNRFTGPMLRVRKEMKSLTLGAATKPLELRVDDFWIEMADDYNHLRDEVTKLREQLAAEPQVENDTAVRKGSLFGNKEESNKAENAAKENAEKESAADSKIMDEMLESVSV